jgi:DNA polymerase I-like protein with 3'-5' exonuclease and polymerase domains
MIYLVSHQQNLFNIPGIKSISIDESLDIMKDWRMLQYDSETSGRDPHLCNLLCIQFGDMEGENQVVVDTTTISPLFYRDQLESKYIIGHNLKFDLQFLYNYGIIPRKVYDTMIVEQLLHLGWPTGQISYSLKEVAWRRLNINIDKTVRGEIIWRGLDADVIHYAAGDVMYLEKIRISQVENLRAQDLLKAAKIECDFIPAIAYLEWCGIHLDQEKWRAKMQKDQENLKKAKNALDQFAVKTPELKQFTHINRQGDLWEGFDLTPKCEVNWSSSRQVVNVAKILGFDVSTKDKKTGEDKESVLEKHLKPQKGINDEFLKLYFDYQEYAKVVTSFGQGHLNAINPKTDRIHTVYRQLGAASGRMSCGSQQPNTDLAKVNKVSPKDCTYPNMQQLPADEDTRGAFTAPKGYEWCSCDYSALESRLGADIYNEESMLDEFLHGSGDMHSLCAYMVYKKEIPRDTPIKEIKHKFPHLRKAVKPIEFSQQFGGSEFAIQGAMGCTLEEAQAFKEAYDTGFPGIAEFKKRGSEFVRKNGYILMCKYSGHKMYWWDHKEWLERQQSFTQEFWENYRNYHKGTGDEVAREVSMHFKAASKYDRMALNAPTQGSGIVILKMAITDFFNWIVDNHYFNKIEIAALVHDECNIIYPKELHNIAPKKLQECMEHAASLVCTKLPIPADPAINTYWEH